MTKDQPWRLRCARCAWRVHDGRPASGRASGRRTRAKADRRPEVGRAAERKGRRLPRLSLVGTKDSVAPLAALLGDEKLSHLARYGLEPIPDPAVDDALRDALGKLKGRPLIGVIGSLGVRRDAKAIEPLAGCSRTPTPTSPRPPRESLGRIGGAAAIRGT